MARLVILGAGIAGQTAALHAKKKVGKKHEIIVISPNSKWNWIPSNIWVGVGLMEEKDVTFELAPIYKRKGIKHYQAKATAIFPEGQNENSQPFIEAEYTSPNNKGEKVKIEYDYLLNATGPKLNFGATEGLGPEHNSLSVCTAGHAAETAVELEKIILEMKNGNKRTIVIGTGHGMATCQGAAFEYIFNVEFELRRRGVRNNARIIWITNEHELGDFGMGGMHIKKGGYITHSRVFTESLFTERGIEWITRSHVKKVDPGKLVYENLDGEEGTLQFDFSMLIPPFSGVGLSAYDKDGKDISDKLFAKNGFMKVDANYDQKPYEEWSPDDWPKNYQNPDYNNIFAVGIAFAPPHSISKPMTNIHGTPIFPTPPRTGMPSGVMAREVVMSIIDLMDGKSQVPTKEASMANMAAACIASAGANVISGTAVSMTMYPIIPDFKKYPDTGRSLNYTSGEIGLAGHWIKHLLHFAFIYKAKANPLWYVIPE
jgi:sulfide:quinone oxidoreductase